MRLCVRIAIASEPTLDFFPESSNGRTMVFGAIYQGSNPCSGAMPFESTVSLSDEIQLRQLTLPEYGFSAWMVFWKKGDSFFPALVKTTDLPTGGPRTRPLTLPEKEDCFAWLRQLHPDPGANE